MLDDFKKYLAASCGCPLNSRFLLTVSGGIDSVVMAALFQSAGLEFAFAHCNFNLRGAESDGDQHFVQQLAEKMQVICHLKSFDTQLYALQHRISIQMAARDLRYAWFDELARENNFDFVATGHNKNDVVETMLLNLARGAGLRGLMGIRPRVDRLIRPLLFATRQEIMQFAMDNDLQWREDSSNASDKYHRNNIRHNVIPALETINPAFTRNAINTMGLLEQTGKLLDYFISGIHGLCTEKSGQVLIDMELLKSLPAKEIVLFELLRNYGVNQPVIALILDSMNAIPGKQFHTHSHTITRDRQHLIVTARSAPDTAEITIDADTALLIHPVHLVFRTIDDLSDFVIPHENNIAAIDAGKLSYPLTLRRWKSGDRFYPLGLRGSKKVSDFLINIKMPLPDKQDLWIIESGGNIVWLVNQRIDDRFKVTAGTRSILLITCNS